MAVRKERRRRRRRKRPDWYQDPKDWRFVLGQTVVVCLIVGVFLRFTVNSFDWDEIRELGAVATTVFGVIKVWNGKA